MIAYITKFILLSGCFFLFYKLFLEKEKLHVFKRFYLLTTWILAMVMPLFSLEVKQDSIVSQVHVAHQLSDLPSVDTTHYAINIWIPLLIFSIVAVFIFIKYLINLKRIIGVVRRIPVLKKTENIFILQLPDSMQSFSFLNYVCIAREDEEVILLHEMAHARQWHSIDVLWMELVKIGCWFNPFIFLYIRAIQLNHEFLADEATLSRISYKISDYQTLLVNKLNNGSIPSPLASSSIYGVMKSRFSVMVHQTSKLRSVAIKSLFIGFYIFVAVNFCTSIAPKISPLVRHFHKDVLPLKNTLDNLPISTAKGLSKKATRKKPKNNRHTIESTKSSESIINESAEVPDSLKTLYLQY